MKSRLMAAANKKEAPKQPPPLPQKRKDATMVTPVRTLKEDAKDVAKNRVPSAVQKAAAQKKGLPSFKVSAERSAPQGGWDNISGIKRGVEGGGERGGGGGPAKRRRIAEAPTAVPSVKSGAAGVAKRFIPPVPTSVEPLAEPPTDATFDHSCTVSMALLESMWGSDSPKKKPTQRRAR